MLGSDENYYLRIRLYFGCIFILTNTKGEDMEEISVAAAVQRIAKALKEDDGYKISWIANVAMPFKDEWQRSVENGGLPATKEQIHEIANKAAEHFVWLLSKQTEHEA